MTSRRLPPASREPCACGRAAEVSLAATPLCRFCWLAELDRIARVRRERAQVDALRDEAMAAAPTPANDVAVVLLVCPEHPHRGWYGFVGEVHGVHDPEHPTCNGRGRRR